jgi:protein-tyrosine phosphatase
VDYDDLMDYFDTDEKASLMMQWAGQRRDVSDPWYTRDFESAYQDIFVACEAILKDYMKEFERTI